MENPNLSLLLDLLLDLKEEQTEIKEITIRNTTILDEHQRRSIASEQRIEHLEKQSQMLNGFLKISLGLVGLAGAVLGILSAIRGL